MGSGSNSIVSVAVGILAVWAIAADSAHHAAPTQSPAADCSSVITSLTDCLSFVTVGSTASKPEGSCCSGLKSVLNHSPDCLCEEFKNAAGFGVNVTKAMALPTACHVSAPSSLKNCLPSGTFFPSPSAAPSASPSTSGMDSAPTGTPAATAPAASSPSPSQVNSAASSPVAAALSAAAFLVALLF